MTDKTIPTREVVITTRDDDRTVLRTDTDALQAALDDLDPDSEVAKLARQQRFDDVRQTTPERIGGANDVRVYAYPPVLDGDDDENPIFSPNQPWTQDPAVRARFAAAFDVVWHVLTPRQSEALTLLYYERRTYRDAAHAMGLTLGALRRLERVALDRLRPALMHRFGRYAA